MKLAKISRSRTGAREGGKGNYDMVGHGFAKPAAEVGDPQNQIWKKGAEVQNLDIGDLTDPACDDEGKLYCTPLRGEIRNHNK